MFATYASLVDHKDINAPEGQHKARGPLEAALTGGQRLYGQSMAGFDLAIVDFTNRHLGVRDVRVEWSGGVGDGCGLGAGGFRRQGDLGLEKGGMRVGGRLVVGELRVQEIVRASGRVSCTIVDADCSVVAEADGSR